jgi:NAD(P)-dependent dehydrogenase (short-subunit alcohol dehydrogenase family)
VRRVLVTAGASGIGLVVARRFAAEGDRVFVTDVDAGALGALPDGVTGAQVDVADEGAMAALAARLQAEWGGLDVVCANAGIKGPTARVTETPLDGWRDCVGVNLEGAFLTAKHMLPLMGAGGVMLFTSSTAGIYGFPYRAPYAAAKWGVIGLMKTVAMEEGPRGIRANAILPGSVNGPRIDRVFEAEAAQKGMSVEAVREGYAAGTALRSLVDPEDVAEMAWFLASPAAKMVTGQAIAVDGFTINPDPQV